MDGMEALLLPKPITNRNVNFSTNKLCLNMIVKNESKIIERLLDSVVSIVDTYCICDTGSTDDTIERIQTYMSSKGKEGIVFSEPFQNFGYNRTVALERAKEYGEYALLLDADMKLVVSPDFKKEALTENGYCLLQKNGDVEYYNTRIVKTGIGVKCVSPTHEYYDFPNGSGNQKVTTLWIEDIGDGGAKADKFERDIRLLEEGIRKEPRNDRYHFYLANSYKNIRNFPKAIELYKQRIELGGWIEEVFYACFEAGNCYKELNDMPNALFWWMEAYNRHPKRTETLYEITKYYREQGKNHISQVFCSVGLQTPYPKDDVLFIKKDVYEYLFDYEHSILAYYTHVPVDHYKYIRLLGKNVYKDNVLSNYKFYVKKLVELGATVYDFCGKTEKTIMGRTDSFTSSSPCILPHSEGYLLNVRYVNYTIRPDGGYAFQHSDGKITTLQKTLWLNRAFEVVHERWIDTVQNEDLRYQGVEDVKVFSHCGELLVLGTVEDPSNGNVAVGFGPYTFETNCLFTTPFVSPYGEQCEKNWCYFHTAKGELRIVYKWSPLTICVQNGNTVKELSKDASVPNIFQDLRGSSNGCLVNDEIWFLTHLVQYCMPRHYYHMLVILDANTLAFKRHSILFKFHGDCIEYGLGLIVEVDRIVLSYSRMDRTSAVLTLRKETVEKELFPVA